MDIQPIVIGTAGHIDHGKSTLVRALTGIDPDRLKEEKERGLTIDLGFAPLELPDGRLVGIVDVPGHERFIRNMVAGATGIDLVLLVVAADDGVMPQTREHLHIMELLGVGRGLIALTKIDMVESDLVDLAEEDVRDCVRGTFLDDAPLVRVSAKNGEGMDSLRDVLFSLAAGAEPRSKEGVFRMPIRRVFSKSGFGTVVTGIPVGGEARIGDVLEVLPAGMRGKVRGLNAYKRSTERVRAGHSSAINFSDVDHHRVQRGDVVATPGFFAPQRMIAARFRALVDLDRTVTNRMPVRLHTGTVDAPGEVILLDRDEIPPGESGIVQLRLQSPLICAPGDRFILRLLSPVVTLGGGAILEESRYRLKRFKSFVLAELAHQEESLASPAALLESLLARRGDELVASDELAVAIKRSLRETEELLQGLRDEARVVQPKPGRWMHVDRMESASRRVLQAMEAWFGEESHRRLMDVRELRSRTGFDAALLGVILDAAEEAGRIDQLPGGKVRPRGRESELPESFRNLAQDVGRRYADSRFKPPTPGELVTALAADEGDLRRALEHLVDVGELAHLGGELYLASSSIGEARNAIVENCTRHGHLEIPELRDQLGTTRKYLSPLLEYFDVQGLTIRQAGNRVLRRT